MPHFREFRYWELKVHEEVAILGSKLSGARHGRSEEVSPGKVGWRSHLSVEMIHTDGENSRPGSVPECNTLDKQRPSSR